MLRTPCTAPNLPKQVGTRSRSITDLATLQSPSSASQRTTFEITFTSPRKPPPGFFHSQPKSTTICPNRFALD
ncbi:hypothetical protein Mapa_010107 [Marchantia paleacea]|nr:hypothetical protein Mapa_010107 [Marchantia paleacea]